MRNLSVGSASFSATNILFFAKAMQKPPYFYELRRKREVRWGEKGGRENKETENIKPNNLIQIYIVGHKII